MIEDPEIDISAPETCSVKRKIGDIVDVMEILSGFVIGWCRWTILQSVGNREVNVQLARLFDISRHG